MVILSYKQGDSLDSSSICVEVSPIEMSLLGDAVERYLQLTDDLLLSQMSRFATLGVECRKAESAFKALREAWRKERRS